MTKLRTAVLRAVLASTTTFALSNGTVQAQTCIPVVAGDADHDGIPDQTEQALLDHFRPYFKFSRDHGDNETFRPTDVDAYLRASEIDGTGDENADVLMGNGWASSSPNALLSLSRPDRPPLCSGSPSVATCSADLTHNQRWVHYYINPNNDARRGVEWPVARAARNIGLYGHVVPIRLAGPTGYDAGHVASCADYGDRSKSTYYKIEYWQFFGYSSNNAIGDLYDHEGDWDSVQVIFQPGNVAARLPGRIIEVLFYAHGRQMAFNMTLATGSPTSMENESIHEWRGPNYNQPVGDIHDAGFIDPARDNHVLQMYRDPDTGNYDHPVVYVEHGGHEFWPSPYWSFYGAQKHGGDDIADSYLAARPPNLGEVEHPLDETPVAPVILRFNGYWGTYSREGHGKLFPANAPPPGPTLHSEWTWPADSSVRWLIHNPEN